MAGPFTTSGGNDGPLAPQVIAGLARQAGLSQGAAVIAAAVALAESGGNPKALNVNRNKTRDVGLWQINTTAHPQYQESDLYDPSYNAKAMAAISKNGTDWGPWVAYGSERYKKALEQVQAADTGAPSVGVVDDVAGYVADQLPDWGRLAMSVALVAVFGAAGLAIVAIGLANITGVSPRRAAEGAGIAATAAGMAGGPAGAAAIGAAAL